MFFDESLNARMIFRSNNCIFHLHPYILIRDKDATERLEPDRPRNSIKQTSLFFHVCGKRILRTSMKLCTTWWMARWKNEQTPNVGQLSRRYDGVSVTQRMAPC